VSPSSAGSKDQGSRPAATSGASKDPQPPASGLKDALLAEIRSGKGLFYNTVVAQAQSIEFADDKVTFAFLPNHRAMRDQFEQTKPWIEAAAQRLAGRKITVASVQVDAGATPAAAPAKPADPEPPSSNGKRDLRAEAMSSAAVQAVLDVFPGEIKDVEEL
jgi:hypothetical protein